MNAIIHFKDGQLIIDRKVHDSYLVKVPTMPNRLHKKASLGLTFDQKYVVETGKRVLFVDVTAKCYVVIPPESLTDGIAKTCSGVKNGLYSYDVKQIMADFKLELIPIPRYDSQHE